MKDAFNENLWAVYIYMIQVELEYFALKQAGMLKSWSGQLDVSALALESTSI